MEPTLEPITLAEAKAQTRITDDYSNELLLSYIRTARAEAEQHLGRGLLTQTWKLALESFADVMSLPMADVPQIVLRQHWHRRFHKDPRSQWLRRLMSELFSQALDEWRAGEEGS